VTPPVNDNFADAIAFGPHLSSTLTGTNVDATTEAGEPAPSVTGTGPYETVWWKFRAPPNAASAFVDTRDSPPGFDTVLGIYTGSAVNALTEIASNDDYYSVQSATLFPVTPATTYYEQVDDYGGGFPDAISIHLAISPCPSFVGTVTPDTYRGTQHRPYFGADPRGTSFWLFGSTATPFVEEYSFPGLKLLQRFDLTPPGFGTPGAPFFGDGSGGVVFLRGNDMVRRDAGGTYTTLYTPATFGAIIVALDAINSRFLILRRTTNSSPYSYTITAVTMTGTATDLASFLSVDHGTLPSESNLAITPDGTAWFTLGATLYAYIFSSTTLITPAGGFGVAYPGGAGGAMIPRHGTIWLYQDSLAAGRESERFNQIVPNCSDWTPIDRCAGQPIGSTLTVVGDRTILPNPQAFDSVNIPWDIWQIGPPVGGGWGRRRFGGAGF
jgi:hypothetical protein